MSTRIRTHRVGVMMALFGLSSLLLLPFATLRASRIQTGDPVSALDALGPWWSSGLVAVWVAIALISVRDSGGPRDATARGMLASLALLGTVGLSGVAATRLLAEAGTLARVSVGLGAWACIAVSYPLLLASRRELGSAPRVTRLALSAVGPVGLLIMLGSGLLGGLAILREYVNQSDRF